MLYSSLDIEDDLCKLGVVSILISGTRVLLGVLIAAFDWKTYELEGTVCDDKSQ